MRNRFPAFVLALVAAGPLASITSVAAEPAAAATARYSVETTLVGKLLDDPAANALLKQLIPTVYGNEMFHSMGRDLTLRAIQQFEPEALSDANLARIQAELDKLPAKG